MEDQDELDGQAFIRAEMEARDRQAQRDHECRMARASRAFVTVESFADFVGCGVALSIVVALLTALGMSI